MGKSFEEKLIEVTELAKDISGNESPVEVVVDKFPELDALRVLVYLDGYVEHEESDHRYWIVYKQSGTVLKSYYALDDAISKPTQLKEGRG